uniref:RNA helicase n=1 Tax=Sinocyclocheilus anshuiensis TaxID=1608454 RepID=A0A671Q2S7_9TELE
MSCDQDAETSHALGCFRDRLKRLIRVEPLLDLLHFLEPDRKDRIKAKVREEGDISAAAFLIDEIIHSKDYEQGWSRELITALETVGCKHAAKYVLNSPPEPTEEAENDSCVRLIDLLQLTLVSMKTGDVCAHCRALGLLTPEDQENIMKLTENQGNIGGARLLLKRLVKNEAGWFSKFLQALEDTEHHDLVRELRGEPCNEDEAMSVETVEEGEQSCSETMPVLPPVLSVNSSLLSEDLDSSVDSGSLCTSADNEEVDMYKEGEEEEEEDLTEDDDPSEECKRDIVLRDYQMEVARPALEEKNIIICLPTGSGKTRVAVYITKEHLERKKQTGQPGKVVVLVNKVPLVEQHYKAEFGRFLKHQYSVERVQWRFAVNFRFTLMVIDECHHTKKGGVYNHIMIRYLKQKHQNQLLKKQEKSPIPLPQILGLTASPGVGGAMSQQMAEEHILQICANLDAFTIKTKTFKEEEAKTPYKRIAKAEERKEDPFGDVIKKIMDKIHKHADLKLLCEPGTQNYEQWVVQKEQNAAKEENQMVRVCAEHLRQYNEALHQSNTIRMSDAFRFLDKYHNEELKTKSSPDEEGTITITDTERFLFTLFKDNKAKLQELMGKPQYENNSLAQLKTNILKEFSTREMARGIIFTQTRLSAIALCQWIQENPKFDEVGVRASYLIGGGDQSVVKPMTAAEQKDVLNKFRDGQINLLIATTVAEEGLDIAECNFVIRYCLVTNEIAMIQARGRGRAEDSSYTLGGEKMMSTAITKVRKMNRADYEKKTREFQMQAIMEEKVKIKKKQKKGMMKEPPSKISLSCRQCSVFVCSGEDIEKIENMHHVNTVINHIECPCLHIKNFVVTYGSKQKTFSKWSELPIKFPAFDYTQHADLLVEDSGEEDMETD